MHCIWHEPIDHWKKRYLFGDSNTFCCCSFIELQIHVYSHVDSKTIVMQDITVETIHETKVNFYWRLMHVYQDILQQWIVFGVYDIALDIWYFSSFVCSPAIHISMGCASDQKVYNLGAMCVFL
jgi:hypothetical protein